MKPIFIELMVTGNVTTFFNVNDIVRVEQSVNEPLVSLLYLRDGQQFVLNHSAKGVMTIIHLAH